MRQVRISFSLGTALAAEIRAGDLADGGRFFAVLDGQREPVLAFLDAGRADGGDDEDRVAVTDGDGAVREAGEFAGFKGDGGGANRAPCCYADMDGVNEMRGRCEPREAVWPSLNS